MLKDEITMDHNIKILLRGTRIIILVSLQKRTIQIAHGGHKGQEGVHEAIGQSHQDSAS